MEGSQEISMASGVRRRYKVLLGLLKNISFTFMRQYCTLVKGRNKVDLNEILHKEEIC